jgi:class 3 adenylate cyclase
MDMDTDDDLEPAQPNFFWKNFMNKLKTPMTLGLFFVSALMVFFVSVAVQIQMKRYEKMITEANQNHLKTVAQIAAREIPTEELEHFKTLADTKNTNYRDLKYRLVQFAEKYKVKYVYYFREYDKDNFQYIIDNDFDPETEVGPDKILKLGDIARQALTGNVTATELGAHDQSWENLLAGFAPVYDTSGAFYCVAGVDIGDKIFFDLRRNSLVMMAIQIFALAVSVIFGVLAILVYRKKARETEDAHLKLQYFNNNMRQAFSTYLSDDVVEEVISDPARLKLGGVNRHMTALFSDVRNFTGIAEVLAPEHLVDLLNYYLSTMSDVLLEQKGTIDKYQGDAIISFFGAPLELADHAVRACTAAVIMKRMENDINRYVLEKGISPSPLLTRIGINTGDMVVGNMGTQKKMNYTIISNAVNIASRLEGVNKMYGTWILASDSTINETKNRFLTRRLDRVKLVGINEAVHIQEILETKTDATDAMFELTYLFHKALDLFEARNWKDAETAFNNVVNIFPNDSPSRLYANRCVYYLGHPPRPDWDGVFSLTEK